MKAFALVEAVFQVRGQGSIKVVGHGEFAARPAQLPLRTGRFGRYQFRYRNVGAHNCDFLALLDTFDQAGKVRFGFVDVDVQEQILA